MSPFRALPDGPDDDVEVTASAPGRPKKAPRPHPPKPRMSAEEAAGRHSLHRGIIIPPRPPLPSQTLADLAVTEIVQSPAGPAGPIGDARTLTDTAHPTEATDTADPSEATEAADAAEPAEPAESADTADHAEMGDTAEATDTDAAEPGGAAETVGTAEATDTADHAEVTATNEGHVPAPSPEVGPAAALAEAAAATGGDEASALPPALAVRALTKSFGGALVVDGVDLTVARGSFFGLVGPNGAGKTTTLSMIAGLLRPDRGSVSVNGIDMRTRPRQAKRQIGVLPDRLQTFDRLTGRQLLHYIGLLRGLPAPLVQERTADLARALELDAALGRRVSDFSAGMTKKIMLAGAMLHSPRLLVLDEPFEAVDPVSAAVILDILEGYVAHGGAVVLSSHAMETVTRLCSRIAVLVGGHILAEGTVDEVRDELNVEGRLAQLGGGPGDPEGLEWLHTFSD